MRTIEISDWLYALRGRYVAPLRQPAAAKETADRGKGMGEE